MLTNDNLYMNNKVVKENKCINSVFKAVHLDLAYTQ